MSNADFTPEYGAELAERRAKHEQEVLQAREDFETEIAAIKERLAEIDI